MNSFQAVALALLLCVGISYTPVVYKSEVQKAHAAKFAQAQRQTVLIQTDESQGSAVVIRRTNPQGKTRYFAFTADHVLGDEEFVAVKVFIRTEGRKVGFTTYVGRVLARDADRDVALLAIDAPPGAFLGAVFASDEPAQPGDPVFACGNFRGAFFEGSVSTGIIAQIGADPQVEGWPWRVADQTTCPVFPGSSGCGMFNADGQILGLVVGGISPVLNVFVPVRAISEFARELGFSWAVRGEDCPADALLH